MKTTTTYRLLEYGTTENSQHEVSVATQRKGHVHTWLVGMWHGIRHAHERPGSISD